MVERESAQILNIPESWISSVQALQYSRTFLYLLTQNVAKAAHAV
jgi:hypothetical protein